MKKFDLKSWLRPYALLLCGLALSLLLAACGGEAALNSTPASGSTTSAVQSSPGTTATTASTTTTTATTTGAATTTDAAMGATQPATPEATGGVVPGATAGGSYTPAGGQSGATSPTPAAVKVIDPNLKGDLLLWDALPKEQTGALNELVATFRKAYPGLKVQTQHFEPDELIYSVGEGAKTSKLPDLILASSDFVTDFKAVNALQPADKAFDQAFLDKFSPNALAGSKLEGSQWGVSFTYSGTPVMLYNKKLVPTAPTTWNELGGVARPLYDAKAKSIGLAADLNDPYILTSVLGAFDGSLLDAQNKPTLDTPQMVSSLGFLQNLLKDKTVRDQSRVKDNQIEYAFRDGRLGVYLAGDWLIGQYAGAINPTGSDAKLDLGVAPLPKIDATGKYPAPLNDGKTFFLGANTSGDRLKAAQTFLQWLALPEQQATILSKVHLLPATKAFLASEAVKGNPVWSGLLAQLDLSKPQPVALEMRAVQAALRPSLEGAIAGTLQPGEAAKAMQQAANDYVAKLAIK